MCTVLPMRRPKEAVPLFMRGMIYARSFHGVWRGGGEMRITLSPRTIMIPSLRKFSEFVVSSVSSKTRFRCWS